MPRTPPPPPLPGHVAPADPGGIARAVRILRAGGLVAVPTETVYGLAADARDRAAVARVFTVKGRPADHPLIVHLAPGAAIGPWVAAEPTVATRLTEAFWPGPLTVVLPRHPSVPSAVTGGRDTVALRQPAHPVAGALLHAFGGGLAAPSANRFGSVSPTSASDVAADLGTAVDLILDGGACDIGVESTVVELVGDDVVVLRPGGVPAEALEDVLGRTVVRTPGGPARAPGMLASHYAPRTPLELHDERSVVARAASLVAARRRVGVLSLHPVGGLEVALARHADGDVATMARQLYRWLRQADADALDVVLAVPPPAEGLGLAVADRLRRAANR